MNGDTVVYVILAIGLAASCVIDSWRRRKDDKR